MSVAVWMDVCVDVCVCGGCRRVGRAYVCGRVEGRVGVDV